MVNPVGLIDRYQTGSMVLLPRRPAGGIVICCVKFGRLPTPRGSLRLGDEHRDWTD